MATDKSVLVLKELEVKELNKKRSGEAFEVLLKQPNGDGHVHPSPLKVPTPKKELSKEELEQKMQAAEERRKAKNDAIRGQLKAEEEKLLRVKLKKAENNDMFIQWAQSHLESRMSQYGKNHLSQLENKIQKFRSQNMNVEELRDRVRIEVDEMCAQRNKTIQQKLMRSEELRQQQLQQLRQKQQEKENHAQLVRQKKQNDQANNA